MGVKVWNERHPDVGLFEMVVAERDLLYERYVALRDGGDALTERCCECGTPVDPSDLETWGYDEDGRRLPTAYICADYPGCRDDGGADG